MKTSALHLNTCLVQLPCKQASFIKYQFHFKDDHIWNVKSEDSLMQRVNKS